MTTVILGAGGQLGRELTGVLGGDLVALTRETLDVTDPVAVEQCVSSLRPRLVLNASAYTAVDAAETDYERAVAVNGQGVREVAQACARAGVPLVHVSTDYVFSGEASSPYPEYAPTAPQTAYGRSKLVGEHAVLEILPTSGFVIRTAWLYGGGSNFVSTIIRLEREEDRVHVVDDQTGQPTSARDLARRLADLSELAVRGQASPGVYHGTNSGETTWYGLARAIFVRLGADPERVIPCTSEQFPRPAKRPRYSVLGHDRWSVAGLPPLRPWEAALDEFMASTP